FPRPLLSGPDMAFLNSKVLFRCFAISSSAPVMYQLLRNGSSLINTRVDLKGNQTVWLLPVSSKDSCPKNLVFAAPASGTRVIPDPSPPVAFEGSRIVLSCNASRGSHLSYTWFFNSREVPPSTAAYLIHGNEIVIERATPEHAGGYYCTAWSTVQNTRRFSTSTEVQVTIKGEYCIDVPPSDKWISFFLFKDGASYQANVTCWCTRGSPPVNFSLYLDDRNIETVTATESLVLFPVISFFSFSHPVSVGGNVKVELTYLYTATTKLAAAMLRCHISRGTFPHISWLLNGSTLPSESHAIPQTHFLLPHFHFHDQRQTLILTKLDPQDSGYFRCRVRDSYDDSAPWLESSAVLVQVTGEEMRRKGVRTENTKIVQAEDSLLSSNKVQQVICKLQKHDTIPLQVFRNAPR
uniref:Ig-like domain-containing protein n=1 Tax=Oryzias sinensis TaxID=183150 RepID=A0A8C7X7T3_9TELE